MRCGGVRCGEDGGSDGHGWVSKPESFGSGCLPCLALSSRARWTGMQGGRRCAGRREVCREEGGVQGGG
eukprot:1520658-Rhodomonas_salina.1